MVLESNHLNKTILKQRAKTMYDDIRNLEIIKLFNGTLMKDKKDERFPTDEDEVKWN